MEVQATRSALAEETGWVSRILPTKAVAPALMGMMLTAADGTLKISGTNGDASAEVKSDVTVVHEGTALVAGRFLADATKLLPKEEVNIVLDESSNRLLVSSGKTTFKVPMMVLEDYPKPPEQPEPMGTIPGEALAAAIGQVSFAAAKDDALPVLTTVFAKFGAEDITFVATDRYRLGMKRVPWDGGTRAPCEVLIRARWLDGLVKPGYPGSVELSLDESKVLFGLTAGSRRSVMPTYEGAFADYGRLLQATHALEVQFDVVELLEAVKRVRLVANRPGLPLRAAFTNDGEMLLTAGESGTDPSVSEVVSCAVDGTPLEAAFNPEFLSDALTALSGMTARMRFTTPFRPIMLDAVGDDSYLHILMPIRPTS